MCLRSILRTSEYFVPFFIRLQNGSRAIAGIKVSNQRRNLNITELKNI